VAANASVHEWVNLGGLKPFIVVVLYECSCNTTPFTEAYVKLLAWVPLSDQVHSHAVKIFFREGLVSDRTYWNPYWSRMTRRELSEKI
jgi:hypothetical protein